MGVNMYLYIKANTTAIGQRVMIMYVMLHNLCDTGM